MRKGVYFIAVILCLGIVAYYSLTKKGSTLSQKETHFALSTDDNISLIEISNSETEVVLFKEGDIWKKENEEVNLQKVNGLLLLATQIEVASPVSLSSEKIIKTKLHEGVDIKFYRDNKLVKSYSICEWEKHYYAKKEKAKSAFRIKIKGYTDVNIFDFYDSRAKSWASNLLINLYPDEIQSIKITYPTRQKQSFIINRDSSQRLVLMDGLGHDLAAKSNSKAISDYSHFFMNIRNEIMSSPISDREKNAVLFVLELSTTDGNTLRLTGHPKLDQQTGKTDPFVFQGISSEAGYILLKYSDFDPILMPLDYFLKK